MSALTDFLGSLTESSPNQQTGTNTQFGQDRTQVSSDLSTNAKNTALGAVLGALLNGGKGAAVGAGLGLLGPIAVTQAQKLSGKNSDSSSDSSKNMSANPDMSPSIASLFTSGSSGSSEPLSSSDDQVKASADSDTQGLMPLLKKYWPLILAGLAATYNRNHQNPTGLAALPALPSSMTQGAASPVSIPHGLTPGGKPASYYSYGSVPDPTTFGMAKGGSTTMKPAGALSSLSQYVPSHGAGGRDDDVNAKLSNNEYVVDAETTALLGDGNPDAGAKKLDRMRENIRKHKGKKLSRGKISPNAKANAEDYLE